MEYHKESSKIECFMNGVCYSCPAVAIFVSLSSRAKKKKEEEKNQIKFILQIQKKKKILCISHYLQKEVYPTLQ